MLNCHEVGFGPAVLTDSPVLAAYCNASCFSKQLFYTLCLGTEQPVSGAHYKDTDEALSTCRNASHNVLYSFSSRQIIELQQTQGRLLK